MRGGPRKGSGKPKLPYRTKQKRIPEPMLPEVESKIEEWKQEQREIAKQILESCPHAYVNDHGQVVDTCHVYWSKENDPEKW